MEKRKFVDQRRRRLEQFFRDFANELSRQGAVVATYRQRSDRRIGPYFRVAVRDQHGHQRSLYLGANSALVQEAREKLQGLQQGQRLRRIFRRARTVVRREARLQRASDNTELAKHGLRFKGRELRGPLQLALRSAHQSVGDLQAGAAEHSGGHPTATESRHGAT
jgi:hypothetical protein